MVYHGKGSVPRIGLSARHGGKHRHAGGKAGVMEYRGYDEIAFGGHRNWSLIIIFCAMPVGPICALLWLLMFLAR